MRYRAQVVKRKMDVMKEERRRQEILMKRREQIREATERYQRLKKNYMPDSDGLYPRAQLYPVETVYDSDGLSPVALWKLFQKEWQSFAIQYFITS